MTGGQKLKQLVNTLATSGGVAQAVNTLPIRKLLAHYANVNVTSKGPVPQADKSVFF